MKLSDLTPDQLLSAVITDETEAIGVYTFHVMKTRLTQEEMKAAVSATK